MKILYLNNVITVPNEKGSKKIEKAITPNKQKNSGGFPKSWYTEQNLRPPEDAEDDEDLLNEDGTILLMEDEVDYDAKPCIINLQDLSTAIDNENIGSVIYLKDGSEIWVVESSYEIGEYIEHLHKNLLQKLIEQIKIKYYQFKYRKLK